MENLFGLGKRDLWYNLNIKIHYMKKHIIWGLIIVYLVIGLILSLIIASNGFLGDLAIIFLWPVFIIGFFVSGGLQF